MPYRRDLERFADIVFARIADRKSVVALRSFPGLVDDPVWVGARALNDYIFVSATKAAKQRKPTVFSTPPGCTFLANKAGPKGRFFAGETTIAEGALLSVEVDRYCDIALTILWAILGPPTVVVASGGIWRDDNGVEHAKFHAHWRLRVTTKTPEEHALLKDARWLATALINGDASGVPLVHPYRWPGAVHNKVRNAQRHATIAIDNGDTVDIDLEPALEALREAWTLVEATLPDTDKRKGRFGAARQAAFVRDPSQSYDRPFEATEFEAVVREACDRILEVAHDREGRRLAVLRFSKRVGRFIRGQDAGHVVERLMVAVAEMVRISGRGIAADSLSAVIDGLEYGRRDPAPDGEPGATVLVPTFPSHEIPVGEARIAVERAIRDFVDGIATWQRSETTAFEEFVGVEAPLYARTIRITTGGSKTTAAARVVAELVRKLRGEEASGLIRGKVRRVMFAVPTHKLGTELVDTFSRHGLTARVFRGREAADPKRVKEVDADNKTPPMCDDMEGVELAIKFGLSVSSSCCSGKSPKTGSKVTCKFYGTCAYQAQKVDAPDIWIVPHAMLFFAQDAIKDVEFVVIDETFYSSGIRHPGKGLTLGEVGTPPIVTNPNKADAERVSRLARGALETALRRQTEAGGVLREDLEAAGFTAIDCTEAISAEWDLKDRAPLWPGMPAAARTTAKKTAAERESLRGFTSLFGAARELLNAPEGTVSGRLFLADVKPKEGGAPVRRAIVRGVRRISAQWRDLPTLMLDATLPDVSILQAFYPGVEAIADIEIATPHATVRQVIGAPVSRSKLFPDKGGGERNRHLLRDAILRRYVEAGKPTTLVVVQKKLEEWLKTQWLPVGISVAHFNALSGIDEFKDVGLLISIGRTLPSIFDVEGIASAITGVEAGKTAAPTKRGQERWYDSVDRVIRTADGAGYRLSCDVHPDPLVERLRFQITECEIVQCIGRGRAVNRTSANPLMIEVWANVVLPITVNEVVRWTAFQTGADPRFEMMAAGVLLESPSDMAAAWPEKWPSAEAARGAMNRAAAAAGSGTSVRTSNKEYLIRGTNGRSVCITYQTDGPKQNRRRAYFDVGVIPNPRAWLEAKLGELAFFEVEMPPPSARTRPIVSDGVVVGVVVGDRHGEMAGVPIKLAELFRRDRELGLLRPQPP